VCFERGRSRDVILSGVLRLLHTGMHSHLEIKLLGAVELHGRKLRAGRHAAVVRQAAIHTRTCPASSSSSRCCTQRRVTACGSQPAGVIIAFVAVARSGRRHAQQHGQWK